MAKKKSRLQLAQEEAKAAIESLNAKIDEMGKHAGHLYDALVQIQTAFEKIRGVPLNLVQEFQSIKKVTITWKQRVDRVEQDYDSTLKKETMGAVAGTGFGITVATLAPTAAMGIATTFGVASTGTAISSLSGVAATKAALAWLGGGALAAGGGGVAAGNALLALAGPIGWSIAGVSMVITGILFFSNKGKNDRLEMIYTLINERDTRAFKTAETEIAERLMRMEPEAKALMDATSEIDTFGTDFSKMTEQQRFALGAYVNQMFAANQLLVNPILGLMPHYTDVDLNAFISSHHFLSGIGGNDSLLISESFVVDPNNLFKDEKTKMLLVALANLLWKIELDDNDRAIFASSLRKNDEFVESSGVSRSLIDASMMEAVHHLLFYKEFHANDVIYL